MWNYKHTDSMYDDEPIVHSDVYLGEDYSAGLKHFKYIKREKLPGGGYRYYYKNDKLQGRIRDRRLLNDVNNAVAKQIPEEIERNRINKQNLKNSQKRYNKQRVITNRDKVLLENVKAHNAANKPKFWDLKRKEKLSLQQKNLKLAQDKYNASKNKLNDDEWVYNKHKEYDEKHKSNLNEMRFNSKFVRKLNNYGKVPKKMLNMDYNQQVRFANKLKNKKPYTLNQYGRDVARNEFGKNVANSLTKASAYANKQKKVFNAGVSELKRRGKLYLKNLRKKRRRT